MYYHRARYYSQSLRRFIQEDPVEGSTSPYAYVHGSPLEATDPSGMLDSYEMRMTDSEIAYKTSITAASDGRLNGLMGWGDDTYNKYASAGGQRYATVANGDGTTREVACSELGGACDQWLGEHGGSQAGSCEKPPVVTVTSYTGGPKDFPNSLTVVTQYKELDQYYADQATDLVGSWQSTVDWVVLGATALVTGPFGLNLRGASAIMGTLGFFAAVTPSSLPYHPHVGDRITTTLTVYIGTANRLEHFHVDRSDGTVLDYNSFPWGSP